MMEVDGAADTWTKRILEIAGRFIPTNWIRDKKPTHPLVNDKVVELVRRKNLAAGTERAQAAARECSDGLKVEFAKYVEKEKHKLRQERKASKGYRLYSRRGNCAASQP